MSYLLIHFDADGIGYNYLRVPTPAVLEELVRLGIPQNYDRGPAFEFPTYDAAWETVAFLDAMGITGWAVQDPWGNPCVEAYTDPVGLTEDAPRWRSSPLRPT